MPTRSASGGRLRRVDLLHPPPFFERFVLEIPDNWAAHATLNIPLDSLMRLLDSALAAGYTAAWDADVSERGFGRRAGIALLPQQEGRITLPAPEIVVDQPLRQRMFDTQATTDDHVMQYRRHGRRFARQQLLQGEKLLGRAGGTPRLLVCVARLCRRQNHRISTPPRRSGCRSRR